MSPYQQLTHALTPRYGPSEAASIARIVLEDAFGARSVKDFDLPAGAEERWRDILERLTGGEPVQYVLGLADFFGYKFKVDGRVLIPRQETEELVALALDLLRGQAAPSVLDIGTGSGCIAITLKRKMSGAEVFALDVSEGALDLAKENARKLHAMVHFEQGDVLDPSFSFAGRHFDLIVSNPPYIPHSEAAIMPEHVKNHEPALALFVPEEDALLFYRRISELALAGLRPGGWLLFEINEFRAEGVAQLLQTLGYGSVAVLPDLSGAPRMARAQKIG
jgi:release factor glutamine methyltransferase